MTVLTQRKRTDMLLALILTVAFLVRVWGIDFGLPQLETRPDEIWVVRIALGFFTGDLNPHFFDYPTLYMYLVWFLYLVYFLVGKMFGRFTGVDDLFFQLVVDPTTLHLIPRYLSAVMGTVTVLVLYFLVRNAIGTRVALMASWFLATNYLHTRESHFGKIDVAMTLLVTLAMSYIIKVLLTRRKRYYLTAGIFSGLAISTKYAALPIIVAFMVAHFCNYIRGKTVYHLKALKDRKLHWGLTAVLVSFLATTPFAVLGYEEFFRDVSYLIEVLREGYLGIVFGRGWWYHLRYSLLLGMGWPVFVASLLGIVIMVRRHRPLALVTLSFVFVYYLTIGRSPVRYVRYVVPLIPFFSLCAACFVERSVRALSRLIRGWEEALLLLMSVLLPIPSLLSIIHVNRLLSTPDSRLIASAWVNEHLETASSVYQVGSLVARLQLLPSSETLERQLAWYREQDVPLDVLITRAKLEAVKKLKILPYEEWMYDSGSQQFFVQGIPENGYPRYIILYESPLLFDVKTNPVPEFVARLLQNRYRRIHSVVAADLFSRVNVYDHQDAFYLPYAGFEGVNRPGPNISIYEQILGERNVR